jgi:hypothetical protein
VNEITKTNSAQMVRGDLFKVIGGNISTYGFATSRNLPLAFPEFGGDFSPEYDDGIITNLQTKQGMWQQAYSDSAKSVLPALKLAAWFDYYKHEDDGWRDFTISNYSTVGQLGPALLRDLQSYKGPVYAQGVGLHSDEGRACGCLIKTLKSSAVTTTSVDKTANGNSSSTKTSSGQRFREFGLYTFGLFIASFL